jgi:hypothetical protein
MATQRAKGTQIPDPFILDDVTLEWLQKRHPNIDAEVAAERFSFWASEYMYANWMRTFQNYVTREADNNKLGPMLKRTQSRVNATPAQRWEQLKKRADGLKFRLPAHHENADQYEQAMNQSNVTAIAKATGRMIG